MAPELKNRQIKTVKGPTSNLILTFFWLAALALAGSCGERKPEGILSHAEMVEILEDLYISEEKVNHLALSRDSSKKVVEALSQKAFEIAAVNDSVFRRSFDYYMEHPREMELIYTALVDTLQLKEQRVPLGPGQQ